jgi:hypothetical protein
MMTIADSLQWTPVITLAEPTTKTAWLKEVGRKLRVIQSAGADWDNEDGEPIKPAIISIASELLVPLANLNMPVPRIAPVLGGGIQFEWSLGERELEIEIMPDGSVEYLIARENGTVQEGELPGLPIAEVLAHARWLLGAC